VDADAGGLVDYDEFIVCCVNPRNILKQNILTYMWEYMGPNRNNTIYAIQFVKKLERFT